MADSARQSLMLGTLLLLSSAAVAQQPIPERRFTNADARFAHGFSSIRGVRELADGRVLVSDGIDEVVMRADLKTGKADTLGRAGQGPGEYKSPDAIYALPNGGTLLVDLGNGRLNFLGADGKYLESSPIAQGSGEGMMSVVIPRGTDSQGRIYFQQMGGGPGMRTLPDSAVVVRWDRPRARFDTLGKVKLPPMNIQRSGGANSQQMRNRPNPYPPQDSWAAGPDGRIAFARVGDYHLEWVQPDGRVVRGRPVGFTPVPIRQDDKKEWVAEQANGLRMNMQVRNGQMSMSFGRGGREGDDEEAAIAQTEWPATKPPFLGTAVWVSPEGEAWVERTVASGAPRTFDVFDATGNLKSRVVLPAGRRLMGFGAGVVYVRMEDENGLQWLERYKR
jgi:hypothetical protein